MKNNISDLNISSNKSYQSINDFNIKCCICNEEVKNEESYMPNCNHSWCKVCNEKINKNCIDNCPICKNKFKNKLFKGRWILRKKNNTILQWKWEKGINDSKRKYRIKKIQEFISNIALCLSVDGSNTSISGLSI